MNREQQAYDRWLTTEPEYGCVQHIERGEECGPDCDALTEPEIEEEIES